jgi:glycosyltransferase involved in cell wall biosynthesis
MRHDFQSRYGVINKGCVISNAAFVPPVEFGFDDEEDSENSLVVGFLSNLTREKGLYLFLDLLRAAAARGESIRGILAGPVALEEDRVAIVRAKDELGGGLIIVGLFMVMISQNFIMI